MAVGLHSWLVEPKLDSVVAKSDPERLLSSQEGEVRSLVAGAWTERKKMYHGGSFLKLADDNMDIQNPEAQNRVFSGF